jgi:hypothetical protein
VFDSNCNRLCSLLRLFRDGGSAFVFDPGGNHYVSLPSFSVKFFFNFVFHVHKLFHQSVMVDTMG